MAHNDSTFFPTKIYHADLSANRQLGPILYGDNNTWAKIYWIMLCNTHAVTSFLAYLRSTSGAVIYDHALIEPGGCRIFYPQTTLDLRVAVPTNPATVFLTVAYEGEAV